MVRREIFCYNFLSSLYLCLSTVAAAMMINRSSLEILLASDFSQSLDGRTASKQVNSR
jgi:hypothetical protein